MRAQKQLFVANGWNQVVVFKFRELLTEACNWDPAHYLRFADHRVRPGLELLARIDYASPATVIDLGCGPGTLTACLAERWPGAAVTGIDSSATMLAKAGELKDDHPNITWQQVCYLKK